MSPILLLSVILFYFLLLLLIAHITGRHADNAAFFVGNRKAIWYIVSFGMIGTSLSGVTFVSVPGWVGSSQFSYMQFVLGYLAGCTFNAQVLLPLYYRLKLTSIYTYLGERLGPYSYKSGSWLFLISRGVFESLRLFLMANVLHISIFKQWGVPFFLTVVITLLFIWAYTFRGGIKTVIWTNVLQTIFMLSAIIFTIVIIKRAMDMDFMDMFRSIETSKYSKMFFFDDWKAPSHFVKMFLAGAFMTVATDGVDQNIVQKSLSCKNLWDAQKNVYLMNLSLIPVNLLFLSLGVLLFLFAQSQGINIPSQSDDLYPLIATSYLGPMATIFFVIGLLSAALSSADCGITTMTTSFTVDIMDGSRLPEKQLQHLRKKVHVGVSVAIFVFIIIYRLINNQNVVTALFTAGGYTYGPLLGLYGFGLFTHWKIKDKWVPPIVISAPVVCFIISINSEALFGGYKFGFELILLNALLTFAGLYIIRKE